MPPPWHPKAARLAGLEATVQDVDSMYIIKIIKNNPFKSTHILRTVDTRECHVKGLRRKLRAREGKPFESLFNAYKFSET
jgi:hypothetical protein